MPKTESTALTVPTLLESEYALGRLRAALPNQLAAKRFAAVALSTWKNSEDLQKCHPLSFMNCLVQSAQLGLEPNTPVGHAYLVPFRNKKKGVMEAQLVIGYKGLIHLAQRSPDVVFVEGHAVRRGDTFHFEYGSNGHITHIPEVPEHPKEFDPKDPERKHDVICFWAGVKLANGGYRFEVMTTGDIWSIEKRYNKQEYGPWKTNWVEMGIKSVIRKLMKQVPLTIEVAQAVATDEASERGEAPTVDAEYDDVPALIEAPPDGPISAEQTEELKKLATNGDAAEGLTRWMTERGYDVYGDIPASKFEEAKEACK